MWRWCANFFAGFASCFVLDCGIVLGLLFTFCFALHILAKEEHPLKHIFSFALGVFVYAMLVKLTEGGIISWLIYQT